MMMHNIFALEWKTIVTKGEVILHAIKIYVEVTV